MKRISDLEFRWTRSTGMTDYRFPEIVRWMPCSAGQEESCYTLLHWVQDTEGWYIKFVGSRPMDTNAVDRDLLWELMRFGQQVLNAEHELNQYNKYRERSL